MTDTFVFPRVVLLVEISRRCLFAECKAENSLGLTKEEARDYLGFECIRCQRWNEDNLSQRDIPEWWSEIRAE
jgi:hypothetical protein